MNQHTFIARLNSILSDNNAPRMSYAERSGSGIDEGRIALAPTGFNRVFKKKTRRKFADYKIALLVDNSGSMQGEKLDYAAKVAHALWYALKVSGIDALVYGFNILFYPIPKDKLESISALHSFMYDKMVSYIKNPDGSSRNAGDGNHDAHAVRLATRALIESCNGQECGKVLLVFSDGMPSCTSNGCGFPGCYSHEAGRLQLSKAVNEARSQGVSCLSVGIKTDSPKQFYGDKFSACVNDLDKLYEVTTRLLESNLVRG